MEGRFLLAIMLMIAVIVVTNILFPPVPPEERAAGPADTAAGAVDTGGAAVDTGGRAVDTARAPVDTARVPEGGEAPALPEAAEPGPATQEADTGEAAPDVPAAIAEGRREGAPPGDSVVVTGPLYRFVFDVRGGTLRRASLPGFESHAAEGPVQLVPEGARRVLGQRLLVGEDTVSLRDVVFEVSSPDSVVVAGDDERRELVFRYRHPSVDFGLDLRYVFRPDAYVVHVDGRFAGTDRGVLLTDLGPGLAFNEAERESEAESMAYVVHHIQEGVETRKLSDVEESRTEDGPFEWAALKSKYFIMGLVAGESPESDAHLGGLIVEDVEGENRVEITATQPLRGDGSFAYRLFLGPQGYERLQAVGDGFENANKIGYDWLQPVIRPLVGWIMALLTWMHTTLNLAYGWVLILFGVLMRVALFPLNQKAMRAQLRNMAVQPLLKEIQEKYKDQPEKLQKEMMRLYKEHGFNPVAGCLPMLLPWPILITLFFVFQNTIELRGVEFLWIPDLSRPDPLFLLPAVLGISMFLLQFVSLRSMDEPNPQMKMMMWIMPAFMVFIFLNLASGLNLYYATANIATLPQQFWIAQERKKARKEMPTPTLSDDEEE